MVLTILMLHVSTCGVYAQTSEPVILKRGTNVPVHLTSDASSNKKNQVTAVVTANVIDKSTKEVLIAQGTPIQLSVERQKAKGMGKGGSIKVQAVSTTAIDGTTVMLTGNASKEGDDTNAALITGLVTGLTVLPVVGFAFFALKGEQAQFQSGYVITNVIVADDHNVSL